ncbi:MAG: WYL domain-containing protein [Lachnospiraceae bacterium]|nr:WYL domain-containing protein [Lachnospiraceae bacterium]
MSKSSNQKLKLPFLMKIMLEKTDEDHGLTMQQIIDELGRYDISAERKSIYSDFEDMAQLGIDIVCDRQGREHLYHVVSRQFELPELKLLIDAVQSSKFITEKKSRQLINKVKTLASENEANELQRQVYVHGRIKTMNESIYYNVDDIHNAINLDRKIRFRYYKWSISKKLVARHGGDHFYVSPWALTWDDENYYLIGFDDLSREIRHYRVDKMGQIEMIEERREGKDRFKDFDIVSYTKMNFGMYSGEIKRVTIEFPDEMCGVFIDRFGKDISFRKSGSGRSRLSVDVAVSNQFFGWIMSLGPEVRLTAPEDVIGQIAKASKRFASNYN